MKNGKEHKLSKIKFQNFGHTSESCPNVLENQNTQKYFIWAFLLGPSYLRHMSHVDCVISVNIEKFVNGAGLFSSWLW